MKKNYILFVLFATLCFILKAQDTQGFFLDDWQPKSIISPSYVDTTQIIGATPTVINIDFADTLAKVSKYVYGNNGNPYSGSMNTDVTLLKYLNDLNPHVIRWPGGNLSQQYFWDRSSKLPDVPDTVGFVGGKGSGQTNSDYYDLLQKTGSVGSICVNIAYARYGTSANPISTAAHYAANWVRFDNGRTKFWELGNENYGSWEDGYRINTALNKDHQPAIISGYLYGKICSVFIDSMRAAAAEKGAEIKVGAVSTEQLITYDTVQMNWNPGMMHQLANKADFYIVHSYYTPYQENSTVATILNSTSHTKEFETYINSCLAAVGHGPMPIALTEWNIFAINSMQDVSYVNGMQSALNVGELIKYKYGMAAKWDSSNGWGSTGDDMGMFAANDEPGVTYRTPHPQFHYMYYFQKCFGDRLVNSKVKGNSNIISYASSFSSGHCGVVVTNKSRTEQKVGLRFKNFLKGKHAYLFILTGGTDNGDFSRKVFINGHGPSGIAGGPSNYNSIKPYGIITDDSIKFIMPPLSVIYAIVDPKTIPDFDWAKIFEPNIVQVKLTNAVVLPDTLKGLNLVINGVENDSITKIERDASDSTILLLTVNKSFINTDTVIVSYSGGNLKTWNNLALVESPGFKVENLLYGSLPEILDARTDNSGSSVILHFSKHMDAPATGSFILSYDYLGTHDIAVNTASFYKSDSSTYALALAEPLFYDYKILLTYSGTDIMSSDGGKLATFDTLLVKNFSPFKPSTIQQAYTSVHGDSIILVFDKNLLSALIKAFITVSLDGTNAATKSVSINSKAANSIIIKPLTNINSDVEIKVSYSGTTLFSYDSVAVNKFTDQPVENRSTYTEIKNVEVSQFQIYPNPAEKNLTITAKFGYSKIEIVDQTGRVLYVAENPQGFPENNTLSLKLAKGIYLIVLENKNQKITGKLVIK